MKASTIIRGVAKEFYGRRYRFYNDRMKAGSNFRNIKVEIGWCRPPSVEFFRECLTRLRAAGMTARMNPLEHRIWVKQG